jgi:hypothetical protein
VVIAHEVVHSIHRSKEHGVIMKLDYEKEYDRVNIEFLMKILRLRGFRETWMKCIESIVIGGSMSVSANGEEITTFKIGKGLKQGGPLSPYCLIL